ncbi:uncharacterized protein LOC108094812 [Drosophila ficusphila]|uniref:uncharacterized protein LOC108094812 n=1 Tax=Drosophila ficusphila TaxID=30025 RepID=UPI0007E7704C|nr:uncharacterized protein LOC108094812 [Drosophila ficusphila]
MCSKRKTISYVIAGVVIVALLIGLLRHVFNVSTFDLLLLTPAVMVISFLYIFKMMSDVEYIYLALLAILAIPISCTYLFVLKFGTVPETWSSMKIFWKMVIIFYLMFLIVFPAFWLLIVYYFYYESENPLQAHII